ncbi:MAG: DUF4263 domain-containing protein [Firmicutes bacterium]|nr:DUF4263 domain-containing protein [Bacillota bacterium]
MLDSMKTKKEIIEFIKTGPTEQDIAHFLKEDLSILAEVYAFPNDEFICIPEYPIDDGNVDYLIMTGRSRMKIHLIEIKGANFNFLNKYTNKINENINEATQQIDSRSSFIDKNYEYFRRKTHEYREKAESNTLNFHYLQSEKNLYVDKNKDIVVDSFIVIGGRSTNDEEESRIRDGYERKSGYRMQLETWDSFIRQLTRE